MGRRPKTLSTRYLAEFAARHAPVQQPRHAVSMARGRDGKYTVACSCQWWDTATRSDAADRKAREHLVGAR